MALHHVNWLLAWMRNALWQNGEDSREPVLLLTHTKANGRLTLNSNTFDLL